MKYPRKTFKCDPTIVKCHDKVRRVENKTILLFIYETVSENSDDENDDLEEDDVEA